MLAMLTRKGAHRSAGGAHHRFAAICGGSGPLRLADRETLVSNGTSERAILIIVSGCVVLEAILPDGRRQVIGFRFPGDILCTAYIGHLPNGHACALTNVQFVKVQHRAILSQIKRSPKVARALTRLAAVQSERSNLHNLMLGQLNRREKLATFLLEMVLRCGKHAADGMVFNLPMTRNHIAGYLGLNADTVSRLITQFKNDGIISQESSDEVFVPAIWKLDKETPLGDALRDLFKKEQGTDINAFFARFESGDQDGTVNSLIRPQIH